MGVIKINNSLTSLIPTATSGQTVLAVNENGELVKKDNLGTVTKIEGKSAYTFNDMSDVDITTAGTGATLVYSAGTWTNVDLPSYVTLIIQTGVTLGELKDVNTGGTIDGYVLTYSAGTWVSSLSSNSGSTNMLFEIGSSGGSIQQIGTGSYANNTNTFAVGESNIASGYGSFACGGSTDATGMFSHSEGLHTLAAGLYSHAEGRYTQALDYSTHAEGAYSVASGSNSHAEGWGCVAKGNYTNVGGVFGIANNYGDWVRGSHNGNNIVGESQYGISTYSNHMGTSGETELFLDGYIGGNRFLINSAHSYSITVNFICRNLDDGLASMIDSAKIYSFTITNGIIIGGVKDIPGLPFDVSLDPNTNFIRVSFDIENGYLKVMSYIGGDGTLIITTGLNVLVKLDWLEIG